MILFYQININIVYLIYLINNYQINLNSVPQEGLLHFVEKFRQHKLYVQSFHSYFNNYLQSEGNFNENIFYKQNKTIKNMIQSKLFPTIMIRICKYIDLLFFLFLVFYYLQNNRHIYETYSL